MTEYPSLTLVTGGLSGIGFALLEELLDTTDQHILVTSRAQSLSQLDIPQSASSRVSIVNVDFLSDDTPAVVSDVIKSLPYTLHGIVLNAGHIKTSSSLMTTRSAINEHMTINFINPFLTLQSLVRKNLLRSKHGSVVYVSSSAVKFANAGRLAYASSKSAMETSIRIMSRELAQYGIRFNTVLPGLTDTKLMHDSTLPEQIDKTLDLTDSKKLGKPKQVAQLIAFLLSENASHITGQQVSVDGGI